MTIYDIKRLSEPNQPCFFSKKTLQFFGQTIGMFKVKKQADGKYLISAPYRDSEGTIMGTTQRLFNPITNDLEHIK